jgi:UDP-N-acetylglucosamine 2-epimerase (non-hydrolysing)
MGQPTLLFIVGTRPEAIKCAPVILACQHDPDFKTNVLTTSQHRELQDDVLQFFGIAPNHDLDLMQKQSDLAAIIQNAFGGVTRYLQTNPVDCVLVQGDTTTAFIAALAAQYQQVPVAHIEAGLRTYDKRMPFPEELNRRLITHSADWHFAPTPDAKQNLLKEGVDKNSIFVVGNPGIDSLQHVLRSEQTKVNTDLPASEQTILVTAHRRENWGQNIDAICQALKTVVHENSGLHIIFLVHPNPAVAGPVREHLGSIPGITLRSAANYREMAHFLQSAKVVLTDSGGIQEEAPVLGKPVLVMREKTERPEGVKSQSSFLVGADPDKIVSLTNRFLQDADFYAQHAHPVSPYGDGKASMRIRQCLRYCFGKDEAPDEYTPED